MKKLFIIAIAVLMTAGFASIALASGLGLGVVDSPHDFSADTWNTREEVCRVCHVPHDHGRQLYINGLLWNHTVSSATYTMYDDTWSSTLDGAQDTEPTGIAKLCLGCHDGTVGVDAFDGHAGAGGSFIYDYNSGYQVPQNMDGTNQDLRGGHPISIVYDVAADSVLGTPGLKDPSSTLMGTSGYINDVLDNGRVQCSTCHDVHNQESVAGTHLLRVETKASQGTASGLCLVCHIK